MAERLISDLILLPDRVRQGDFVLKLSKGVAEPEKTVEQYVVTPQLAASFDDALDFVRSAVEAVNSKACYLHGSFGAGKSHFMAVLHLLLQHHPAVRNVPALAKVCAKHGWVENRKFLLVPYHMIGVRSMEAAIFGQYVEYVMAMHPHAPLPGIYMADAIFENAQQLRRAMGDDVFFEQLNRGQQTDGGGWGKLKTGWGAGRFDSALQAPPADPERLRLVGDLVERVLPAFKGVAQGKDEAYVDLDLGLSILSSHAESLGYDGLILFLDELILWLASHSADLNFVQTEGNKLVKLVESRKANRPVPIISFVARQRDLRELIGENVTGAEQLNFSDVLSHWEGRFYRITLEDRNLPLIAKERVLKPKNEACRAELEEAFERTAQVRQEIMEVLLTREADRAMFKMVYPFSPALIQSLVAVSSVLQRERTALKIMLHLLVDRRDTLRLGDVIPLGDLWDVVAHDENSFSDVMRLNFQNAKKLYQDKLLPMLEQQHEVDLEVDRQRAKSDNAVAERLSRFQNDDRLVKSLLLCSLVHGVEALKDMNCSRLAALNHGTIRSRIPGREHQVVAQKIRTWVDLSGGAIRLSDDPIDPTVSIQLSAVDTESIIEKAKAFDNAGTRQFKVRQMLFKSLGVPEQEDLFMSYAFMWRGTKRACDLLFTNVRTLPDESLRSKEDWHVIVDFPFDTEGHTPAEDEERLEKFREKREGQRTLVWLPWFFSTRTQNELRRLVIIDRLLVGNNLDQYAEHLSLQDRQTARLLLQNSQSALSQRIVHAIEAAYAIRAEPTPGMLDTSYDLSDSHFKSLLPTLVLQKPVGTNLGEALEHLLDQALSHQFPRHPKFLQDVKLGKDLRQVLEVCREAARTPDGRVYVEDKNLRLRLRNICNPLELGQMSETHFVLDNGWKQFFNQKLAQTGQANPQAGEMRKWVEERGLPREIENLLILVYADQTNRSFRHVSRGGNYTPALDDLPDELELQEQTLPDLADWTEAVARVAEIMGHSISKLLNAANLATLAEKIQQCVTEYRADCDSLPDHLQHRLSQLGTAEQQLRKSNRVRTATAMRALLAACDGQEPTTLVGVIAQATVEMHSTAMGKSLKSARAVLDCLKSTRWDLFSAVGQLQDERRGEADRLIVDVRMSVETDEHALVGGLAAKLSDAEGRAIKLLTPAPPPEPKPGIPPNPPRAGWKTVDTASKARVSHTDSIVEIESLLRRLRENSGLRLTIQWTLEEESP